MGNPELQKFQLITGGKEEGNIDNVISRKKLTIYGWMAFVTVIAVCAFIFTSACDLFTSSILSGFSDHPIWVQFLSLKVSEVLCAGIVGFLWALLSYSDHHGIIPGRFENFLRVFLFLCRCFFVVYFGSVAVICFLKEHMLLDMWRPDVSSVVSFLIGNGFIWLLLMVGAINFAKSELVYRFLKRLDRCFWSEAK